MKPRGLRLLTAALVAGSAGIGFMPLAHAADSTTTLAPSAAAWYQPNPTCGQASGCVTTDSLPVAPPVDVPLSPYPAGTEHIGYASQAETARAYLTFPYSSIAGTVTGGTLDVPLDTAAADGSAQPETSKIQVCLVSGTITPTEGAIAQPPVASCDAHAEMTYVATPSPHLHADLEPLLTGLLTTSGVALLPDATEVAPSDAWRAVFSSASRVDAAKSDPPVMRLSVTPTAIDEPQASFDVPSTALVDSGNVATPVIPNTTPEIPATVPDVTGPVVQQPSTPAVQPVSAPQTVTIGYAYPAVWLLPLVFLVLLPLAARALTKDLTPTLAST